MGREGNVVLCAGSFCQEDKSLLLWLPGEAPPVAQVTSSIEICWFKAWCREEPWGQTRPTDVALLCSWPSGSSLFINWYPIGLVSQGLSLLIPEEATGPARDSDDVADFLSVPPGLASHSGVKLKAGLEEPDQCCHGDGIQ